MDIQTIKHIAKLSYLELSDGELGSFAKELTSILDYVSELDKVSVEGVPAEASPHTASRNIFRRDAEAAKKDIDLAISLVEAAPEREDGYVKVKAVL